MIHYYDLHTLTSSQVNDLLELIHELNPEITVTAEMLERAAKAPETHLFAALDDDNHVLGSASLCVFDSPTGRKASIEDVVVSSGSRRQGIGRTLIEHIIDFARQQLGDVDLHLTSRPERVAANELYRTMGFEEMGTNMYQLKIRDE